MPLETRVAGALILLYGLPGERVRYLTTADLHGGYRPAWPTSFASSRRRHASAQP